MGKLKELREQGVVDLESYFIGMYNETQRILDLLETEQKRSNIGFIQYEVLRNLIESSAENKSTNA